MNLRTLGGGRGDGPATAGPEMARADLPAPEMAGTWIAGAVTNAAEGV